MRAATRQHDLLRHSQLVAAGLSRGAIERLLRAAVLHRLHRGVYKVGTPAPSADGRLLAAVYAMGPGSAVSHRDAGQLGGLRVRGRSGRVDVTTKRGRADRPGITAHRVRRLDVADVTTVRGIPVTTVARTLVDLSDVLSAHDLRTVIHEAEVAGLFDLAAVDAAVRRAAGRDTRAIAAALAIHRPRPKVQIEHRLERIARRAGLPEPRRNAVMEIDGVPFELDRYYPDHRLCLEADGYAVHRTRRAFHRDRRKDRILRIHAGITVLRYTWEDVTARAGQSEAELRRLVNTIGRLGAERTRDLA